MEPRRGAGVHTPTVRQSLVAKLTRLYPLYSGCGTLANKPLVHRIAGAGPGPAWSRVPGGEVLAPLDDFVGRAAFYAGDLDPKITWVCARIVRAGDTVLDIGANIGIVTLWLSKLVGARGSVHAFEPNPALQRTLEEALARNRIANVQLHPVALGARDGHLELRIPRGNAGAASLDRNRDVGDCDAVEVPVRSLSGIVARTGITSIRLIKIDVEGFEAEVLQGGAEVLGTVRPEAILFESNQGSQGAPGSRRVIEILSGFDYAFFAIPRCLFRMRLARIDPAGVEEAAGHDFLAVPRGHCYERIARLVGAS